MVSELSVSRPPSLLPHFSSFPPALAQLTPLHLNTSLNTADARRLAPLQQAAAVQLKALPHASASKFTRPSGATADTLYRRHWVWRADLYAGV